MPDPSLTRAPRAHDLRVRATLLIAAATAACVLLALVAATPAQATSTTALVLTGVLYVAARQITFGLGRARTTAVQLALVPAWLLVPPALLPVAVAGLELAAWAVGTQQRRWAHRPRRPRPATSATAATPEPARGLGVATAAWASVGPAIVIAVLAPGEPELGDVAIYALAVGAQVVAGAVGQLVARGVRLAHASQAWLLDATLAPLGVIAASVMLREPWMVLALLPVPALLGQFSRERDEKILRAAELSHAYRGTAQLMGDVLEADDAYTGGEHTEGVVQLSLAVGRELALTTPQMRNLEFGALLHDVGKLRVPNEIINKPGKLTDEEWAVIKQHPAWGQEMLERVGGALAEAAPIVRAHHERWDGNGYPDGLAAHDIPVEARIITACDSFSAMTTDRSYRRAMTHAEALAELASCTGSQFDPDVVAALSATLTAREQPAPRLVPVSPPPAADPAPSDAEAALGQPAAA